MAVILKTNPAQKRIIKVLRGGGALFHTISDGTALLQMHLLNAAGRPVMKPSLSTVNDMVQAGLLVARESTNGDKDEYHLAGSAPPGADQPEDDCEVQDIIETTPVTAAEMRSVVELCRDSDCTTTAAFRDALKSYETLHERVTLLGGADRVREVLAEMDSYSELVREVRNSPPAGGD